MTTHLFRPTIHLLRQGDNNNGTSKNGTIPSSFSGYVGHVIIFSWMLTTACCLEVGLGLGLWLDLVSGWLVAMRTYFYFFPLSLSLSQLLWESDIIVWLDGVWIMLNYIESVKAFDIPIENDEFNSFRSRRASNLRSTIISNARESLYIQESPQDPAVPDLLSMAAELWGISLSVMYVYVSPAGRRVDKSPIVCRRCNRQTS